MLRIAQRLCYTIDMKPKLIVFDLHKTLIKENSWYELNMAMGVTQAEDDELMRLAEAGAITDAEGQKRLLTIYQQRGDVSRLNIERILGKYTYLPHAHQVISELQARGYEVVILSGAMDVLVRMVAAELGVVTWRAANTFVFDEDDRLVAIDAPVRDVDEKLRQLTELVADRGIGLEECLVVGDGSNDSELFRATGNGVTFADSKIASDARWVVNDLRDVLTIAKAPNA